MEKLKAHLAKKSL